jgi:HD-like signal output (HDOD) protein
MIEQELKSKSKHIDSFLRKEPKVLRKLDEMIEQTNEFALKQYLYYSLMKLTSDVKTFKSELVSYLANDAKLAQAVVRRATLMSKRSVSTFLIPKISKIDVQKSIQKIGYGAVHNELQLNYAKQYIDLYFKRDEQVLKRHLKRSVRMAFLTIELAKLVNYHDLTSVFFAAMNYYIGEMVLFMRDQKRYEDYKKLIEKGLDEKTAELASFGFDLGELSTKMLTRWQMPEHIIDVIANKENPEEVRNSNHRLDTILRFANYVVKAMDREDATPKSLWNLANDYLLKLDLEIDSDKWEEEIKTIFIRVLETEYTLFNSKS